MIAKITTIELFSFNPSSRTNQEDYRAISDAPIVENVSNETMIRIRDESRNTIIYSALVVTQFLGMIIRSATFFTMCILASINLHNRIFFCLMRAPISFFDSVPTGNLSIITIFITSIIVFLVASLIATLIYLLFYYDCLNFFSLMKFPNFDLDFFSIEFSFHLFDIITKLLIL